MRITLLANRDLASNLAINLLLQKMPKHNYRIFLSAKVGKSNNTPEHLKQLAFMEQSLFNQIVYPLIDAQQNFATNTTPSAKAIVGFNTFAGFSRAGITVSDIQDINSTIGYQTIAAQKPELIISIGFGQILKAPIIDIPEHGIINLHSGKMPEFRGVMATFWAMLENKKQIGTTLHFIDSEKINAGQIIASTSLKVDYQKSYLHNVLALYPDGVNAIVTAVRKITQGKNIATQVMDLTLGNYFSFPEIAKLDQFVKQGMQLINYDEIPLIVKKYM